MKSVGASVAKLAILLALLALSSTGLRSAELIMLEQDGCHWCEIWHEEIGQVYPKTAESKIAPLRMVDIHGTWPDDLADVRSDHYTPTFILVNDGKEVARLRGYPGDNFFWPMLEDMLSKLPIENEING